MNELTWYRTVDLLARVLPRRAAYALARPASAWVFRHAHELRRTLAANLDVVLETGGGAPGIDRDRLIRQNFENFGKYLVDFFQAGRMPPARLARLVEIEHPEILDECRDLGRGVIGLTAHVGSWELGAIALADRGCPVTAVVLRQPNPALDALFQSRRTRRGIRVLPADGGVGEVLAALRRDEFVALVADRDYSGRDAAVPFFQRLARLPRGPAVLAARSGSPILPAFVLRRPDDRCCMRILPAIHPRPDCSVDELQQRVCAALEEVIAEHLDQWFAYAPLWD